LALFISETATHMVLFTRGLQNSHQEGTARNILLSDTVLVNIDFEKCDIVHQIPCQTCAQYAKCVLKNHCTNRKSLTASWAVRPFDVRFKR
ncbi:MAG: hypothetical protein RR415_14080, partial [Ruthenibacterium sp.]